MQWSDMSQGKWDMRCRLSAARHKLSLMKWLNGGSLFDCQTALVAYMILPALAQELNTLVLVIVIFPR